jgi:hypothetical protein
MEQDEAMKFAYAQAAVKNRRLAYGETVDPCDGCYELLYSPNLYVEAFMQCIGLPAALLGRVPMDHDVATGYVESLISDELLPFAKTNFSAMNSRTRRSLYQELAGVITSSRRIILSAKAQMGHAIGSSHPIERHLASVLGTKRVLVWQLQAIIEQACESAHVVFEGPRSVRRTPKRDLVHWIEVNWGELGQLFTSITANQRTLSLGMAD